jgi:DNA-binding transcriptional MocR family regulator
MISESTAGVERRREAMTAAQRIKARIFEDDYRAMLALSDARRRDLAASRERAQSNPELVAHLLEEARRRGQSEIDWPEHFRNARMV